MNAFVIYDSFSLACKANWELQRAAFGVGGEFEWFIKPCPTKMLFEDGLADQALADARDAHFLLFALHDSTPFSERFGSWLERWARARSTADAAIGILSDSNDIRRLRAYPGLLKFAERHHLGIVLSRPRLPEFIVSGPVLVSKLGNSQAFALGQGS
jgi:hypothetical protein